MKTYMKENLRGHIQESLDFDASELIKYDFVFSNEEEMIGIAKILYEYYGVHNYYYIIKREAPIKDWKFFKLEFKEFTRNSGYPTKSIMDLKGLKNLILGTKKKKIRKPEEDPFDEENWGFVQENVDEILDINILKKVERKTYIVVNNSKEHRILMRILEDFGYSWPFGTKPTDDNHSSSFPIIILNPDHKIYKSRDTENSKYDKYDFSDFFLGGKKKIRNLEVDPFNEENWGYVKENINREKIQIEDLIDCGISFKDVEEMEEVAIILSKYFDVYNLDGILEDVPNKFYNGNKFGIDRWRSFTNIGKKHFVRDSGNPRGKTINLEELKDIISGASKKKIKNLEIDPFEEEKWGYVQESANNVDIEYLKSVIITYDNIEEMKMTAEYLQSIGFKVFNYKTIMKMTPELVEDNYDKFGGYGYDGGVFIRNRHRREKINIKELLSSKKLKKIRKPEEDPFDEEDWGYIKESVDPFFQKKKNLSIRIHTEEEYNKLMKVLEDNDFIWASGHKPTEWPFKGEKVIMLNIFGRKGYHADIRSHGVIFGQSLRSYNKDYLHYGGRWENISYSLQEFLNLLQGYDNPKRRQVSKPDIDPFEEEKWWEMKNFKDFNKEEIINEKDQNDTTLYYSSTTPHHKYKKGDTVYFLPRFSMLSKYDGKCKIFDVNDDYCGIETENGIIVKWISGDELLPSEKEYEIAKNKKYDFDSSLKKRQWKKTK